MAVAAAASTVAVGRVLSRWQRRWGATEGEVAARLPGDDLVAPPASQVTRAITVHAPPSEVWPWLVQLGADRGGFYSYDWLENLFGLGIHSADRIVPEWQERAVGDLVAADAKGSAGWFVMDVQPERALVIQMGIPGEGRPTRRDDRFGWEFSWAFVLDDGGDGTTRLLVRERAAFGSLLTRLVLSPLGPVSFVMTRRMLLGIARRSAASAPQTLTTSRLGRSS